MKRRRFEGDPSEALRGADPLDRLDVPLDTTGAHARALLQEVTNVDTMEEETTVKTRGPVRRRFAVAASAVVLLPPWWWRASLRLRRQRHRTG